MTDTLTALIGKWRSEAELNDWDAAHALTRCADELEAALTASPVGDVRVRELATEFVNYWTGDNEDRRRRVGDSGGCGMCGGTVHSTTCFVGRFQALLTAAPVQADKETR
jgi:hypothetical protein